ncbi:MAG: 50S ribosomal protein L11 methyltransferase [Deltaproteobacteria bacterium]|nr:50S ribosomal protein L11 methyltransferase [Deltaproteobacteria bacterium]
MLETNSVLNRYQTVETVVDLGSRSLKILTVRDINALVDAMGPDDFGPDERLPYWATIWPSSIVLAREIISAPELVGPVLELGAGLGVGSIAAGLRGLRVLATDYEPDALAFLAGNAERNGVRLETSELDWRDDRQLGAFGTIIASDVLYEARKVVPLATTIAKHLAPSGVAWVADPGRGFLTSLQLEAMERQLVPRVLERGDVSILELRRVTGEGS